MGKSYIDDLLPASFRDVACYVKDERLSTALGRRVAVHEYPLREGPPNVDDMGPVGKLFTLELFNASDDIKAWREELTAAIDTPGPGKLIHPRHGEMMVQAGEGKWRYRGSKEFVQIPFYQTAVESATEQDEDTADQLDLSADNLTNGASIIAANICGGDFGIGELLDGVGLDSITGMVDDVVGTLDQINGQIDAAIKPFTDIADRIDQVGKQLGEIISAPKRLIAGIVGVVSEVLGVVNDVKDAFNGYRKLGAMWGDVDNSPSNAYPITENWKYPEPLPLTTPRRAQEAVLNKAVRDVVQIAALATTVKVLANTSRAVAISNNSASPFASANEAITLRDELIAEIDALTLDEGIPVAPAVAAALTANASPAGSGSVDESNTTSGASFTNDNTGSGSTPASNPVMAVKNSAGAPSVAMSVYPQLQTMKAALVAHIEAHGNTLPRVKKVRYNNTLPLLVISHQLYGDTSLVDDLLSRNAVKHPLFINAGTEVEALNV